VGQHVDDNADSEASDHEKPSKKTPGSPAPHKPLECANFANQPLSSVLPGAIAATMTSAPAVLPVWFSLRILAECCRPDHAHFERPPPFGLLVVRTSFLRI
jgi:hypothetical protein